MSTIAVIPARGGSKRIPRKNIRPFGGRPMIGWPIQAARASALFDAIIVSTDDDEIASVAQACGAEAPFRRPAGLSGDHTPTLPVISHAIQWFEEHRGPVAHVCCIYATAPFLDARLLQQGLSILKSHPDAEFAFSVTSYAYPIFRSLKINSDGSVTMFWPEHELTRSQDLPEAFHDAGQFYWGDKSAFLHRTGILASRSYPVILPRDLVYDIDTLEDWDLAEKRFALMQAAHRPTNIPTNA
jgi:N-acylneuraminate cytidylyltransferase